MTGSAVNSVPPKSSRASCSKCNDTGVIETGNNDVPCDCPAGNDALFNMAGIDQPVPGRITRCFLNSEKRKRFQDEMGVFIRECSPDVSEQEVARVVATVDAAILMALLQQTE